MGGTCSKHGGVRNAFKILVGTIEDMKQLGITGHWWEDNIRMVIKGIDYEAVEWIHVPQKSSLVGCSEHGKEAPGSMQGGREFIDQLHCCHVLKELCSVVLLNNLC
jgi:hypothetical protein